MKSFGAVLTAMITPFTETGAVDYQASAQLARHLVAHGSDGLVICGSTGEGAVMTAEEKENILVIQISVKQCVYILIRYMTVAGIKTAWKMYACT